jgi:hypothetical protein
MLLVLRSGETDRRMALAKLRMLSRLPVRVLGAVLNATPTGGDFRYYSYLYSDLPEEERGAGHAATPTVPPMPTVPSVPPPAVSEGDVAATPLPAS